ncbi:unnamed protein product, partial [Prorocentrum cordatum]
EAAHKEAVENLVQAKAAVEEAAAVLEAARQRQAEGREALEQAERMEQVRQSQLQLVGVAALLIAAKFEEIKPPDVKDLVYYTADAYTRQQVVKKELDVLTRLRFEEGS